MYYRLGLRYALADPSIMLAPIERGFAVQRTYECLQTLQRLEREAVKKRSAGAAAADAKEVKDSKEAAPVSVPAPRVWQSQGSTYVEAGASVRVTVTVIVPVRRVHVALIDYLPAGFEAESESKLFTK